MGLSGVRRLDQEGSFLAFVSHIWHLSVTTDISGRKTTNRLPQVFFIMRIHIVLLHATIHCWLSSSKVVHTHRCKFNRTISRENFLLIISIFYSNWIIGMKIFIKKVTMRTYTRSVATLEIISIHFFLSYANAISIVRS